MRTWTYTLHLWLCYSRCLGYYWLSCLWLCKTRWRKECVVRQAAVLRDADGQLRGHLSDGTIDDWKGEFTGLWGGELHLVGYLWKATGLCACARVCVNSASPHPTKLCRRQSGLMWHFFPSFGEAVAAGWEELLGWASFPLQGVLQVRTVDEWGDDKIDWHLLLTYQPDITVSKTFALC